MPCDAKEIAKKAKRDKARAMRYKHALVRDLNLETVQRQLWEIGAACEDVRWMFDSQGMDELADVLDSEDEAYGFRMEFSALLADVERLQEDLENEWVPECYDDLLVAARAGDHGGGLEGYDSYEHDYFGIGGFEAQAACEEAATRLERLRKRDIIEAAHVTIAIVLAYAALRYRYDCLQATMDIIRGEVDGHMQLVREIEKQYEAAAEDGFEEWRKPTKAFDQLVKQMPDMYWIQ